ncbi:Angiotensin-converting enzyme [Portunus trituberculatus]|uniref:Angiotensin-converting enzyme n=1 Tax=Portunus trituberculatus TaxID=210409 RepID=A0A5B7IQP6_PORTR|nr:Angiotensin-converting enzyme [Portunus trituberculatus]
MAPLLHLFPSQMINTSHPSKSPPKKSSSYKHLPHIPGTNTNENEAVSFLRQYDVEASVMCNRFMEASWDFNTNVTDFNRRKMVRG